MSHHLPGFVPFCEIHEFLFFYHLYSSTGKKPLQSLFHFFFFNFSGRPENTAVSLSNLVVVHLLVGFRYFHRLAVHNA